MLELYHHGSSVCAARVRVTGAEKGIVFDRYHYIDILAGEQFADDYRRINPKCVVPALVHEGRAIVETTLICHYLDEEFEGTGLLPADPYARYRVRTWTKAVDELLHPACAELTYVCCHRHVVNRLPAEQREAFIDDTPERSVKGAWRQRKRELIELGFDAPGVDSYLRIYDQHLFQMEAALADGRWLAGDSLTHADIALLPYVNRLDMLSMSRLWNEGRLPRVTDWFDRMKARPAFVPELLDWCPEDLTRDLAQFGAASWPQVEAILDV